MVSSAKFLKGVHSVSEKFYTELQRSCPRLLTKPKPDDSAKLSPVMEQPKMMGLSTLDLFILTFNCAKNAIEVPVFAAHLQQALGHNATTLPDLVVV